MSSLAIFSSFSVALSNKLTVIRDGVTGNSDATCMVTEAKSMEWYIMVGSKNIGINAKMIIRSTNEDVDIVEGIVMSSNLRRSSLNQQLNSINSTLLIMPSFMPGDDIMLICNAHALSLSQTSSSTIRRSSTSPTSEF